MFVFCFILGFNFLYLLSRVWMIPKVKVAKWPCSEIQQKLACSLCETLWFSDKKLEKALPPLLPPILLWHTRVNQKMKPRKPRKAMVTYLCNCNHTEKNQSLFKPQLAKLSAVWNGNHFLLIFTWSLNVCWRIGSSYKYPQKLKSFT